MLVFNVINLDLLTSYDMNKHELYEEILRSAKLASQQAVIAA